MNIRIFLILFTTMILVVVEGKKDKFRFPSSSLPIQVSPGSSSSSFPDFFLYSNSNNGNAIGSIGGSNSVSSSEQCQNPISEDYCAYDDINGVTNLNDKMNLLSKLEKKDYDSEDNPQKNHQELTQLLMKEVQALNTEKRNHAGYLRCSCHEKNDIIDLGYSHYPRYLITAVCQTYDNNGSRKCRRGAECKPIEYRVRVLTHRTKKDAIENDHQTSLLPEILRSNWKYKTVTVATGCFCTY